MKQEVEISKLISEERIQEIYAKQGIDILTKDGKIDYSKIQEEKTTSYKEREGYFKDIDDILYGKIFDDEKIDIQKSKKKSRSYDLDR